MKTLLEHVEDKIRELRRQLKLLRDAKRRLREKSKTDRKQEETCILAFGLLNLVLTTSFRSRLTEKREKNAKPAVIGRYGSLEKRAL